MTLKKTLTSLVIFFGVGTVVLDNFIPVPFVVYVAITIITVVGALALNKLN